MSKVTNSITITRFSPVGLTAVAKLLTKEFPLWELVGNDVFLKKEYQPQAKVVWKWTTIPTTADLVSKLLALHVQSEGGTPVEFEVDLVNPKNTVALMDIRPSISETEEHHINFVFRASLVPKGKKANKVVRLHARYVLEETLKEQDVPTSHITAPLHIPGLASGAIGKELFDDVTQILQAHYPMWELEDGKVYISENYRSLAEVMITYRAAHVPTGETFCFPIDADALTRLLRRNYDSGQCVPVEYNFDIDNPNHRFSLLDIYVCSESETPQLGFIFQVSLVTRNSSTRKLVNLHALYPILPLCQHVPTTTNDNPNPVKDDFEGDVLVGYLETAKPEGTWEHLVAALIFSFTTYGKLNEFIANVHGSFFITPIINLEGVSLVRTDAEMDVVVNMFQDVGYKYPDLLALYHLIQYLRLTKDNKIKLASVSFNHPEKTSRYILSQPY